MNYIGDIPHGLHYTKEHEWVKLEGPTATVGVTDYAQHALTDVVFVELPKIGKLVQQGKPLCVIESVKSVSDVFAPLSGEVIESNESLSSSPESVNNSPYGDGWIAKLKVGDASEVHKLMSEEQYKKYLEGLDH